MIKIGYTMMCEQSGPNWAQRELLPAVREQAEEKASSTPVEAAR